MGRNKLFRALRGFATENKFHRFIFRDAKNEITRIYILKNTFIHCHFLGARLIARRSNYIGTTALQKKATVPILSGSQIPQIVNFALRGNFADLFFALRKMRLHRSKL